MAEPRKPLELKPGLPRTLAYSNSLRIDLRLLECDEDLLEQVLARGVCFKGSAGDEAVLCTDNKTYAVKNVETTNLVLLMQGTGEQADVVRGPLSQQDGNAAPSPQPTPPGMMVGLATQQQKNAAAASHPRLVATARAGAHLELVPVAPRLMALDALLAEAPYGADDDEAKTEAEGEQMMDLTGSSSSAAAMRQRGYTWEQLLERVQASAGELREALAARHALLLNNRYRSFDPGYLGMLLELILLTAVEQSWPVSAIPGQEAAAALQQHGYDPRVTLYCLSVYGTPSRRSAAASDVSSGMDAESSAPAVGTSDVGSSMLYSLQNAAVCRHFAQQLLAEKVEWELTEFMHAWAEKVPEGMAPDLGMLRGEALVLAGSSRLRRFPLSELPAEAGPRFAALFAAQPKWEWGELEPYVQGLQQPGQTAEALLLKYARASQAKPTDAVTYSMR